MNPLEALHTRIDQSDWDIKQEQLINEAFIEVSSQLEASKEFELFRKSEMERQVFAFSKKPENGLSFKVAGTRTLEDGSEIPFEWPDIKDWEKKDFEHIKTRFQTSLNLFARTEYGLFLYYSGQLRDNRDALALLKDLFLLSKSYYRKSLPNDDKEHYILYFKSVLANAFKIAFDRKSDKNIKTVFDELIVFNTEVHNNWDIKHKSTLRSIIDLTDFANDYKKYFAELVSLEKYLDQNYEAALEISKSYNWGAIYICDISQMLADSIGNTKYDWQTLKAEQFEAMVQPAIDSGNLAAVSFIESALAIYKKIGSNEKVKELSKLYTEVRNVFRLIETRTDLPQEESDRIYDIIKEEVLEKESKELLEMLITTPMFAPLEQIKENAQNLFKENTFTQLFPTSIVDKHGNTVEVFIEEDEKRKFQFWQSYEFAFQLGSQTLIQFFFEAFKANKISFSQVIIFLEDTWIGHTYSELYSGFEYKIRPLDVITPGLKAFFEELEKWRADNDYNVNFVTATDSLVTKSEYLIRFFCKIAGIPTFVDKQKGTHKVKMEKNIDELLRALEDKADNPTGFLEDHRVFFQFILSQKAGPNLRNRIAHGLMDAHEYSVLNPLLILTIILKLSSYSINFKNDEFEDSTF